MPTVSVVTPTYNRADILPRCIDSVLSQTFDDLEHLIIDDCSTDGTEKVVGQYGDDRLEYIRLPENRGANAARNRGIKEASGDYVAFLDSDDEWFNTKLERQLQEIERSTAGAIYTGVEQVKNGEPVATKTPNITGDITAQVLQRSFGGFSSIMVENRVLDRVDEIDDSLPSWQDWDFYLRISEETTFTCIDEPLVRQHLHDGGRISDDYLTKRDNTAPQFLEKHRPLAEEYGVSNEFEATVVAELGWAAISNGEFSDARRHFRRSLMHSKSNERFLLLLLTLGGGWTYKPAQKMKQYLLGDMKFKSDN